MWVRIVVAQRISTFLRLKPGDLSVTLSAFLAASLMLRHEQTGGGVREGSHLCSDELSVCGCLDDVLREYALNTALFALCVCVAAEGLGARLCRSGV